MWYSWSASGAPAARVEPSFWPVHFRNLKLAQRGLAPERRMVYPSCSIRNCQGWAQSYLRSYDFETERLHFDGLVERGMRCAPGLWHRFGPDREPIIGPGRAAGCVHPFEFQQEQEDTQERQIEPARTAEDRSRALPRNPGGADS